MAAELLCAYGQTDLMKLTVVPNDTHYSTVAEQLQRHWVLEHDLLTDAVDPLTNKCRMFNKKRLYGILTMG